jgi:hypothetical protein
VDTINCSRLHAKKLPGGVFEFTVPIFSLANPPMASDRVNMGPPVNGSRDQQPQTNNKVKIKKEEVKEQAEIRIKTELKNEPGASEHMAHLEHLPSLDSTSVGRGLHHPAHSYDHSYQGDFGGYSGFSPYWISQSKFFHPVQTPNKWKPLPEELRNPDFPTFHPATPYCNFYPLGFGYDSQIGQAYEQSQYGANSPPVHATRQNLIAAIPSPPGTSPAARLPTSSFQHPNPAPRSAIPPSNLSPIPSPQIASPSKTVAPRQPDDKRTTKRKLPNSPGDPSDTNRPLKSRISAQETNTSGADEAQANRGKPPGPGSGVHYFGNWFQEQVADRKRKLSHIERVFTLLKDGCYIAS